MKKDEIFTEIFRNICLSAEDIRELDLLKVDINKIISEIFIQGYKNFKYIGSAATYHGLHGKKDIDGVIIFNPFDKIYFIEGAKKLNNQFEKVSINESPRFVRVHIAARYKYYDLGLGAIDERDSPYENAGADISMHPDFIFQNMKPGQERDIVLTKLLFKNSGVYGRVLGGGFSLEQLAIHFGSFEQVLAHLALEKPIYIDNSRRYHGEKNKIVVTYPYCGLYNMCAKLTDEDFSIVTEYAKRVLNNPESLMPI